MPSDCHPTASRSPHLITSRSPPTRLPIASATPPLAIPLDAQLCEWLGGLGYRYRTDCALGGAVAIVEDATEDERLCVCLDGGMGATLPEWREERRAQIALERAGWR